MMSLPRPALAGVLAAGALGVGALGASAASRGATVNVANHGLGRMLVDGHGRTIYLWKADRANRSVCSSACASVWPPVASAGSVHAGRGVNAHLLRVVKTAGRRQVTYAGHPLYLYAGDRRAGQVNGQGSNSFGAPWFVVSPRGGAITKAR
jgi:predicted lipoprotein with Yx(FWY)xxD motif